MFPWRQSAVPHECRGDGGGGNRTRARFPRPAGTKGARSLGTLFTAGRLAGRGLELLVVCLAVVLVALVFSGVPWAAFGIAGLFLAGCGRARVKGLGDGGA